MNFGFYVLDRQGNTKEPCKQRNAMTSITGNVLNHSVVRDIVA